MNKRFISIMIVFLLISICGCSKKTFTVNFNTDGGTFIEAQTVKKAKTVQQPDDPQKEGYLFKEWQLDEQTYDFEEPVTADMTLKAIYESISKVIVKVGNLSYTVQLKQGETLKLDTPEVDEDKIFEGWLVDGVSKNLSDAKNGSIVEAQIIDKVQRIACTAIKPKYNSYWATEGSGNWNLEIQFFPSDTTDIPTYFSENEDIVTVDQKGNVKTHKVGTTKIHVQCGEQELIVGFETAAKEVLASKVNLSKDTITIPLKGSAQIKATVSPDNTTDKTLTYSVDDTSIVHVSSSGEITAKSPGVTKVTVKASGDAYAECKVIVEGETVIFKMENNVTVKAGSQEKIPYKAVYVSCWEGHVNKQNITDELQFHTAYTSALDIDGNGNVYAKGAVYETVDIDVYFTWSDGSSLTITSPTYTVRVVK